MNIRKTMAAFAAAAVSAAALCLPAGAEDSVKVSVTISDGTLQVKGLSLTVTDADGDGAITVNDALYRVHEEKMPGGYAAEETEYGLSMTKLWGIENGGAYGYYVNDASAWSLLDPINEGDYICAFAYTDTVGFSDMYCFFDKKAITPGGQENAFSVTLSGAAFDENWNPITIPVAGAEITLDGSKTGVFTDENGYAELTAVPENSSYISAVSDTQTLVPPYCRIEWLSDTPPSDEAPSPYENPVTGASLSLMIPAASLLAAFVFRKRK